MYVKEFLFLQFIAFITYASLKKLGKEHAAEEALLTMRNLKVKVYDEELLVSELTKQQKQICERLEFLFPPVYSDFRSGDWWLSTTNLL